MFSLAGASAVPLVLRAVPHGGQYPVRGAFTCQFFLIFLPWRRRGASQSGAALRAWPDRQPGEFMALIDGELVVGRESPLGADLELLFQRHTADMHADTPPESIHMLPREALECPEIAFFVLREASCPMAMGAVKRIAPGQGEIKSMHVLSEARGRGHSRRMLTALINHARADGMSRLNLETGVQPTFIAARRLYASAGFVECGPFGDYRPDPNSLYMTLPLTAAD
jgi:putative acetyltransferase